MSEFGLPFRQNPFQFGDPHRLQIPFFAVRFLVQADVFELEDHGQLVAFGSGIQFGDFRSRAPGFADGQQIVGAESRLLHFLQEFMQLRSVSGDSFFGDFSDQVDDIHAEAADAFGDPAVHHRVDFLAHGSYSASSGPAVFC